MVSISLTDDELQHAAQAARVASVQAEQDAERQTNPTIRAGFERTARKYREIASKLERARGVIPPLRN